MTAPALDPREDADIKLRVAGAQACRRLLKLTANQTELGALLHCKQPEISRVHRLNPRASRRVLRDAVQAVELLPIAGTVERAAAASLGLIEL